ncbi:inner membrane protein [Chromohalobacter marismortui]|uniref:Inner membrane protein n=1 Tax=Chromohalobacter marismortui TaxID=42055 RepID=A0A4R7NTA2_9GAMM|nr:MULTISPECIES: metal-dependent hydrolase [Chromohalobacter]MCI0509165.1 metal-dependent hydrolase [Chromohalobacter sp.]MCI0592041.1 metal-dependent hydrolase [Chromohalobacter sp.]TDU23942.1 inner membrane protein [Chromohalobacter marismortui]
MDSLTQACLGAAIGGTVLGRRLGRKAIIAGAALGTLPDLDVVIDYGDAVADYTYHRGFSHSLFILAALALSLTLLARAGERWRRVTPPIGTLRWGLLFGGCLLTHPLLDAFTTYGTQLWWPLATPPVSWHSIFIIDPLFTLPLLVGIVAALIKGDSPRLLGWGLTLACFYLTFAVAAQNTITARIAPSLASLGLDEAPRLVQPTPFNTLLWRVTVVEDGTYYEGVVSLFDGQTPLALTQLPRGAEWEDTALATAAGQRLQWFAGPFLRYRTEERQGTAKLIATDLRLGTPGYHMFNFTLAERRGDDWYPIDSERVAGARPDRTAFVSLFQRLFEPQASTCLSLEDRQAQCLVPRTPP